MSFKHGVCPIPYSQEWLTTKVQDKFRQTDIPFYAIFRKVYGINTL